MTAVPTEISTENGPKKGKSSSVGLGTDATYVEVSSSSYGMGKVLVVQRTVWILRVRSICTALYENGESTNTVPNKPLIVLLRNYIYQA